MNINTIFISKGFVNVPTVKVISDNDSAKKNLSYMQIFNDNAHYALMIQTELMRYGYILSPDAFKGIQLLMKEDQAKLAVDISEYFKNLYGDDQYTTLFGDYPNTVLSMSDSEWLAKQIWHYWSSCFRDLGIVEETYDPNPNDPNDSEHVGDGSMKVCCRDEYKIINVGSADDIADVVKVLVKSQQSLVDFDKDVVKTFYENIDTIGLSPMKRVEMLDVEIPFKETLCIVANSCEMFNIKDITDVLRVATYISGGDISLAPIPTTVNLGWSKRPLTSSEKAQYYFKHFNNREKRILLSSINDIAQKKGIDNVLADMKKYIGRWIRIGEILHPSSSKNASKYPYAAEVYSILRNNPRSIVTWQSKVEELKKDKIFVDLVNKLSERPGEFFRQLDYLIRTYSDADLVDYTLSVFASIIPSIKTKMIYELLNHFLTRKKKQAYRKVVIKGARKPVDLPVLDALDSDIIAKIHTIILKELSKRFKESVDKNYGDLTDYNVYLSRELEGILLPTNMRSANNAAIQVARGTKMALPEKCKCIRFFLHWKDENGTEDLDLSSVFYSEDFIKHINVGWNSNYKLDNDGNMTGNMSGYADSKNTCVVFSGDVRNRRGNNAEYIDVDVDAIAKAGYRYIVLNAHDYNAHGFKTGYVGYMARTEFGTPGEVTWAPNTVENCIKLGSTTQSVVLGIVDTFERKFIYIDEDTNGIPVSSIHSNIYEDIIKRHTESQFFNGLTLLTTYFTMSNIKDGHIKVLDEKTIKKTKADIEKMISTKKESLSLMKKNLDNYKTLSSLSNDSDDGYIKNQILAIESTEKEIDSLSKNLFFTFEEMSNYASIMKFMFE